MTGRFCVGAAESAIGRNIRAVGAVLRELRTKPTDLALGFELIQYPFLDKTISKWYTGVCLAISARTPPTSVAFAFSKGHADAGLHRRQILKAGQKIKFEVNRKKTKP